MDLPLENGFAAVKWISYWKNGFGKLAITSTVVSPKTSLLEEQL